MCQACGYQVKTLKRVRVMNILLGDLKPGEYREIGGAELKQLYGDCRMKF
jgi:23S rRNA pseudouridine2604 synthase